MGDDPSRGAGRHARAVPPTAPRKMFGDYNGIDATNDGAIGVWNDVREATICPAFNTWYEFMLTADNIPFPPSIVDDCPAGFGNSDIWSGAVEDPTP